MEQEPKIEKVCDRCGGPHNTDEHELFGDTEKRTETSYTCDRCGGPHQTENHELFGDTEKIK